MKKKILRFFAVASFLFAIVAGAVAQKPPTGFSPPRTFDALHYTISTKFDRSRKMIFGETVFTFHPLKDNLKEISLDSVGLNYESVGLGSGKGLEYKLERESIRITLDKPYSRREKVMIKLSYSSKPKKGVYFIDASRRSAGIKHEAQIWTQGETAETRHWFPSYDFPDDKATTEQFITVDDGETAVANGELIDVISGADGGRTFHYSMKLPHSTYLTSFVVGKYKKIEEKYGKISLGYYLYPEHTSVFQNAFSKTREMMRIFEEVTDVNYPFSKYDQTIVAKFSLGGMENITATTLSDREIFLADFESLRPGVEDLVAHELAHSWFGNLVTCKNWSELYLNEGFATFMEAVIREKMYGHESYLEKLRNDVKDYFAEDVYKKNPHGVFNRFPDLKNDDSMFDAITYQKAGAVIHTLRETVGEDAFWRGVRLYLRRHRGGNVETSDLRQMMEETSKMDLGWFFTQWIYGGGYPRITVDPVYDKQKQTLEISIAQTQKPDALIPNAFILPLEVEIQFSDGSKNEKIKIDRRNQVFSFPVKSRPTAIEIDPQLKIPLKRVKQSDIQIR